ncbi:hypothetical protein [Bacillus alkalicellulosilyticus]|uniref:hypothetical protein n=1 Tax=Alkalihalobacterium alkalicellulosilyticum TaxID=1912214 RepID=UPI0009960D1A|nr:hypothetical protein [Bacillus alkalicellulosilyticus]
MRVQYIEVESGKNKQDYDVSNVYVRIGEKVKLRSALCEVVDIVHYPAINEENHHVDVFVKVIKELPDKFWGINLLDVLDLFRKS